MFEWKDYLALATNLAASGGEAEARTAVSRAYYSAFNVARKWVAENDRTFRIPEPGASHKFVWDWFNEGNEVDKRWIANEGRKLRIARNSADYNDRVSDISNTAKLNIDRAKKLVERIDRLTLRGSK